MNQFQLQAILVKQLLRSHQLGDVNYGSLKIFSQILVEKYNCSISVNTLARMVGLKSDERNHYSHTIDLLARIAGFSDFKHYFSLFNGKQQISNTSFEWTIPSFFYEYTFKAAAENDKRYFLSLADYLNKHEFSWAASLELGLALCSGLRVNKSVNKIIPHLVEQPVFVNHCFETFVDVDNLFGYYGLVVSELSIQAEFASGTWLFSNSLKMRIHKEKGQRRLYKKTGDLLLSMDMDSLAEFINAGVVYPIARWLLAVLDFTFQTKNILEFNRYFEWYLSLTSKLSSDQNIIFISLISDLGVNMTSKMKNELLNSYLKIKSNIIFEVDSLYNAGLNLSLLESKELIDTRLIKIEIDSSCPQLFTCSKILKSKLSELEKKIV